MAPVFAPTLLQHFGMIACGIGARACTPQHGPSAACNGQVTRAPSRRGTPLPHRDTCPAPPAATPRARDRRRTCEFLSCIEPRQWNDVCHVHISSQADRHNYSLRLGSVVHGPSYYV